MQVSPLYDLHGSTAYLGACLAYEMLCVLPGVKYIPRDFWNILNDFMYYYYTAWINWYCYSNALPSLSNYIHAYLSFVTEVHVKYVSWSTLHLILLLFPSLLQQGMTVVSGHNVPFPVPKGDKIHILSSSIVNLTSIPCLWLLHLFVIPLLWKMLWKWAFLLCCMFMHS